MGGCGALESHVDAVAQGTGVLSGQGVGLLGHGDRFAREGRFVHLQLRDLDQAQVGRNLVARLQQHDVAGYQHAGGHHLYFAAAQHGGMGRRQLAQRGHGLVCPPGLHEADDGVEHYDDQDDQRVGEVADHAGDHGCAQQHQHHEVLELVGQQRQGATPCVVLQFVGAVLQCALRGLFIVQAGSGIDLVGLGELVGVAQVGICSGGVGRGKGVGRHAVFLLGR